MKKSTILVCLIPLVLLIKNSASQSSSSLSKGFSLSVEDSPNPFLVSPKNKFKCGFYKVGTNAYIFAIWFSNSKKTIAWSANRDQPVNGYGSVIKFQKDGTMSLTNYDGNTVWSTNTSSASEKVTLLDTGNLVITDFDSKITWQSFDFPTDTILAMQAITKNTKLTSASTKGSVSTGYYSLLFDNDNVLKLIYNGPEISSIYWPNPDYGVFQNGRTNYNSSRIGLLNEEGNFMASDGLAFSSSDIGFGIQRRLTLDYDGNLRLYSLDESSMTWSITYQMIMNLCDVHGLCGKSGICTHSGFNLRLNTVCACPPGFEMRDVMDWRGGCEPKFNLNRVKPGNLKFLKLPNTDFWGYDLNYTPSISLKECKHWCRQERLCKAVKFRGGDCFAKYILFNGRTSPSNPGDIYLKFPNTNLMWKRSTDQVRKIDCNKSKEYYNATGSSGELSDKGTTKWVYFYWFVVAFGLTELLFISAGWWFVFRRDKKPTLLEEGYKMISSQFKKFTYKELRKATNDFKEELGRGGSGAVYKGIMEDNRLVAVKKLEDVVQGEEEFWAEVSVIGKIYHMNLVRMWGFCCENSRKLLVYEFIENGSLNRHLFVDDGNNCSSGSSCFLSWEVRYKIAVGIAKALAYLHHECLEWIVHCDVKPENILLDSEFEPKIADFGLAKLWKRGGVGLDVSQIRGTRGYMAPEWTLNLPITAKADVYSFGVVLLEILMGTRASSGELMSLVQTLKISSQQEGNWVGDYVDRKLNREFNSKQAMLMMKVVVSCLEEERTKRPNMDNIIQMLVSEY